MEIVVKGAREHNLKNVSLKIPRNQLVVFTGVSGSGKSSLVFDAIYAEAYRQFLDSLSTRAQKYLPKLDRPDVDEISGISPAVVVDQKRMGTNPRSTVGTVTEIYTYLRLLYSRCGTPPIGDSTLFSFNTPEGACPVCKGLGEELILDQDQLLDWDKSLAEGAIKSSEYRVEGRRWNIVKISNLFEMTKPLRNFTKKELSQLLYSERVEMSDRDSRGFIQTFGFEGVVTGIMRRRHDKRGTSQTTLGRDLKYFRLAHCSACDGLRLNKQARTVKVAGKTITDLVLMPLTDLRDFMAGVRGPVAKPLVTRMMEMLGYLIDIGVGYLSLNRSVGTLSGGESQRVKMGKQLGSSLVEMIYVLDEPSIGLHPRDIGNLIAILKKLRDRGNSVLVVEHDPAMIRAADQIVDLGPGAGAAGGEVVFQGAVKDLVNHPKSLTGRFLSEEAQSPKRVYRQPTGSISIKNARLHNLKNVSVDIPAGVLVGVTGVAGAGKSTLINDIFVKEHPEAVVVDQSAVARSVRSNPATYVGAFDPIRKVFAESTGKKAGWFSFNSQGACSKCKGLGFRKIEMHFLGYVYVDCEVCKGRRYSPEVLRWEYRGKNIADILAMTVAEALTFFAGASEVTSKLTVLQEVGLGYLTLGQSVDTLSGGEAQRIKITRELNKKGNIYIFDEPTTGLHMADIAKLLMVLDRLVDAGNTVIVIEHNLAVIGHADWLIDLGPEGGDQGGKVVAEGTPEEVAKVKESYTGQYLRGVLSVGNLGR